MKKVLILVAVMVLALSGISYAAISGSAHDMTAYGAGDTMSSCQYCHTPHLRTNTAVTGAPLWNREQKADGTWTLYGGGTTLNSSTVNAPGPNSKTCLSCHDGSIAVGDVLVGTDDTIVDAGAVLDASGFIETARNANLGVDLSNEHPVGVTWVDGRAGLIAESGVVGAGFKLYNSRIECASCHEPHDQTTNAPFLRVSKATICSACHATK